MNQPPALDIQMASRLWSKHRRLVLSGVLLGGALSLVAAFIMPTKYRVHFVLTIYSKYFQTPLIGDFLPSLSESSDARAQRESLMRQTLTPEFIDSIGSKYGIYASLRPASQNTSPLQTLRSALKKTLKDPLVRYGFIQPPPEHSKISKDRQELLSKITIFSLNSTTFNIGFSNADPQVAFQVAQDLHSQILQGLLDVRMSMLVTVRDAIQRRAAALTSSLTPSPANRGSAQDELQTVRDKLHGARAIYTASHPLVRELHDREQALMRVIKVIGQEKPGGGDAPSSRPMVGSDPSTLKEIASDLIKKLNYLDIAIDSDRTKPDDYFATLERPLYPASPSGPGKALVLLGGLIFGLVCAVFIAAIREYFDLTALRTNVLAERLGVPLLGELPRFPQSAPAPAKAPSAQKSPKPDGPTTPTPLK
ncbi:MAG: hypothetical protein AAB036_06675 [Elusimicrobiota bacterium]